MYIGRAGVENGASDERGLYMRAYMYTEAVEIEGVSTLVAPGHMM